MKKAIIMLLACTLVLSWNDDSIKVKVTNSVTGEDTVYDQSAAFAPGVNWSGNLDWSLKNNQIVAVKKGGCRQWF